VNYEQNIYATALYTKILEDSSALQCTMFICMPPSQVHADGWSHRQVGGAIDRWMLMGGAIDRWMLHVGRFLTGIAGGMTAASIPVSPANVGKILVPLLILMSLCLFHSSR